MYVWDRKFRAAIPNYVGQSLLAIATLGVVLYFLDVVAHAAIVAALGSGVACYYLLRRRQWIRNLA